MMSCRLRPMGLLVFLTLSLVQLDLIGVA